MPNLRVRAAVTAWSVLTAVLLSTASPSSEERAKADASLNRLRAGNDRFVRDASAAVPVGQSARQALAAGQSPIATILSCADARVPPEYIFNTALGELFVIRAAGEVVDRSVLATGRPARSPKPAAPRYQALF